MRLSRAALLTSALLLSACAGQGQPGEDPTKGLGTSLTAKPRATVKLDVLEGVAEFHGEAIKNADISLVDARTGDAAQVIAVGAGHVIAVGAGHLVDADAATTAGVIAVGAGHAQDTTNTAGVIAVGAGHLTPGASGNVIAVGAGHVVAVGAGHFSTDAEGHFSIPVAGLNQGAAARLVVQQGASALTTTVGGTTNGVIAVGAGHVIAVGAGHYGLKQAASGGIVIDETSTSLSHLVSGVIRLTGRLKEEASGPVIQKLIASVEPLAPSLAAQFKANPSLANTLAQATSGVDGTATVRSSVESVLSAAGNQALIFSALKDAVTELVALSKDPANRDAKATQQPTLNVPLIGTGLSANQDGLQTRIIDSKGKATDVTDNPGAVGPAFGSPSSSSGGSGGGSSITAPANGAAGGFSPTTNNTYVPN